MHSFKEIAQKFTDYFNVQHFPEQPNTLYEPGKYFLSLGAKRIRPVMCLMGNEMFNEINPDTYVVASALELFHNFTLIHDDIMDNASLRRGKETVHSKYGIPTAILSADVMMILAYKYLSKVDDVYLKRILEVFNRTAREVCEGQQLDMDYERMENVSLSDYIKMIELKTSVLLAGSLQLGAILGGASYGNTQLLYEFGKNLGIAFQIQDDYLDAFGDPDFFGKEVGGDIKQNKKTFLLIHALESASATDQKKLKDLLNSSSDTKVQEVLAIFKSYKIDDWAQDLKNTYLQKAFDLLEEVMVLSVRKKPLLELAEFLVKRNN
jgi:geranylgeranyl diphosphate synthase type II